MKLAYIALFGLLGVFSRYGMGVLAARLTSQPYLYGTFLINIIGSFLIGAVYVVAIENTFIPPDLRVGIMVGFLGGFTTFSSYCLEAFQLANEARYLMAASYFVLSPCLGVIATVAGVMLSRYWLQTG